MDPQWRQKARVKLHLEAQRLWPFTPSKFSAAFRYQYVISKEKIDLPGFQTYANLSWQVHSGSGLPVCELADRDGRQVGYVIGIAVGPDGLLSAKRNRLPVSLDDPKFWEALERYLVEVAGRYAFLVEVHKEVRFYVDPVGMIGAVYNKKDRLLAASPLLAITGPMVPNPKFDFDLIREHGGKFSLFHTADARVRRLNPNSYLSLDNFSENRHWPKDEVFATSENGVLDFYQEIQARTEFNIAEISKAYSVSIPVTGGQDSRLILAFAKKSASNISRFYTHINNYATRRDAAIGKELCAAAGVPHEVHDRRNSEMQKWQRNAFQASWNLTFGIAAPLPHEYGNGVILNVPENDIILRGHQTDILRAVYVFKPKKYWSDFRWQIQRMLIVPPEMFTDEVAERFKDDFYQWQRSLPINAMEKAADFMFLEVYYNSGLGAMFPALWRNFYMSPFNSRRLITLALSFSEDVRRSSFPVFDLVERACPPLSAVPFDFELHADLSYLQDASHCREVTASRIAETRDRLAVHGAATEQ